MKLEPPAISYFWLKVLVTRLSAAGTAQQKSGGGDWWRQRMIFYTPLTSFLPKIVFHLIYYLFYCYRLFLLSLRFCWRVRKDCSSAERRWQSWWERFLGNSLRQKRVAEGMKVHFMHSNSFEDDPFHPLFFINVPSIIVVFLFFTATTWSICDWSTTPLTLFVFLFMVGSFCIVIYSRGASPWMHESQLTD